MYVEFPFSLLLTDNERSIRQRHIRWHRHGQTQIPNRIRSRHVQQPPKFHESRAGCLYRDTDDQVHEEGADRSLP